MGYYVDLITPLELIPEAFKGWIEAEICENGLLEEIDKLCDTYRTEGTVESYEVWIHKLDWYFIEDETYTMHDSEATINYPFEVAIIVDMVDEEKSEKKAIQLQAKTIMSIFKNFTRKIFPDMEMGYINFFKLTQGFNDGSMEAMNQEEDVIIKGFHVELNVTIYWLECMNKAITEGKI